MNKQYIFKLKSLFLDVLQWKYIKYKVNTKLKKFKKSSKKKFFIKYRYPHRKSISKCKSYCAVKHYLTKEKLWYDSKKKSLNLYNFEKINYVEEITYNKKILFCYDQDFEFNKIF